VLAAAPPHGTDEGRAQVERAEAMAASLTKKGGDPEPEGLAAAMKKLDMDNYDNDDGNLITQILQARAARAQPHCRPRQPRLARGQSAASQTDEGW